ncbi:MAG: DEAD/DEAH box helicase family protein [Synergistes sp.]|nr:DEAD/DEAH box helicase family protein [Synergistes sp.]
MMDTPVSIKTVEKIEPMIYSFSLPEVPSFDGWTKIGYTERQSVEGRVRQQSHTVGVTPKIEWSGSAFFDDGSGLTFTDHDLHAYLGKLKVERRPQTEWFHVDGPTGERHFRDFKKNHGVSLKEGEVIPYKLRQEQADAVARTTAYFDSHPGGEFLWNAKPRFGKTLSVYDLCIKKRFSNVLIVTNRPAIANSWYEDYRKFVGPDNGYYFVSDADALKNCAGVLSRERYVSLSRTENPEGDPNKKRIRRAITFLSLQDLKGSSYFGGSYRKLKYVTEINWDLLVIDEAHEGVDTYRTDSAFKNIKRSFTLHLSGTPFRALASNKFNADAIYNWTYADEQKAKAEWDESSEGSNPYAALPVLNMYTYQMSKIIEDEVSKGIDIEGETKKFAFDMNEFFAVNSSGNFVNDDSVDKFLDAMTVLEKYPFSTPELRDELKHTFWLLDRVAGAKALAKKLADHPVFKEYKVILAAGDGNLDDEAETRKSYEKVVEAIKKYDKTITLSVGQLTTGITIPEWSAVLMLSNVKSPSLYMQAAFRAQNPYKFKKGSELFVKKNAYVFDFDPARTLIIYDKFANDIRVCNVPDDNDRKENVKTLLNFFPVIGEDKDGTMVMLDAEAVFTIPRRIKSEEIVRRGFMCDFLFRNIGSVFNAPKEFLDIINKLEPVSDSDASLSIPPGITDNASVDDEGNVNLASGYIIGRSKEIFGEKIYGDPEGAIDDAVEMIGFGSNSADEKGMKELCKIITEKAVKPIIEDAKSVYGSDFTAGGQKRVQSVIGGLTKSAVGECVGDYRVSTGRIEAERSEALSRCGSAEESAAVNKEFDSRRAEAKSAFKDALSTKVGTIVEESKTTVVENVERLKKEKQTAAVEDKVRDRLKGFARTIPSFLMAYGNDEVTIDNFDTITKPDVFTEVTSLTPEEFRMLRDGFDYKDPESGVTKHHDGVFDSENFNVSVEDFMKMRRDLANYFDESAKEDIFDYVPPQKTNQIFTPKATVREMVSLLEAENPGCFDDPDKTFIDLYMKSGMYIAEIVKRLHNSPKHKELFPDEGERLRHIFAKQVYGLAPTEIIFNIAKNYVLGFDDKVKIEKHNLRQADALPYAKEGKVPELLEELFGGDERG